MVAQFEVRFDSPAPKLPPQNIEAEEAILGGILLDPEAISRVAEMLTPEVFSLHGHQIIYRALLSLYEQKKPTDFLTAAAKLRDENLLDRVGGQSKLLMLVERTVTAVNIDQYAKLIIEKHRCREIIRLGNELASEGYAGKDLLKLINKLEDVLDDAKGSLGPGASLVEKVKAIREIESPVEQWHAWQRLCQKTRYSKRELLDLAMAAETDLEIEIHSAQEFSQKKLVKDKFLMEGLLRRGTVALLTAEAKTGKSLLHYHLTYHIASGTSWGDFNVSSKNNCLIIQTDEPEVELQERTIVRGLTDLPNVDLITKFAPSQLTRLKKKVEENKYDFIVLDSLTSINRLSGYGENDQEFSYFVYELKELAEASGACILLVHHTNKCPVTLGLDKVAGHSSITRAPSDIFILHRPKAGEETHRILSKVATRDAARSSLKLDINPENNSYDFLGYCDMEGQLIDAVAETEDVSSSRKITSFLASKLGVAYEAKELSEFCGIAYGHTRKLCGRLWKQGQILRKKAGAAFAYFIQSDPPPEADHPRITSPNPDTAKNPAKSDPVIRGSEEKNIFETNVSDDTQKIKNFKNDSEADHRITFPSNPYPETVSESDPQVIHPTERITFTEPEITPTSEPTEDEIETKTQEFREALPYLQGMDDAWNLVQLAIGEDKKGIWDRLTKEEKAFIHSLKPKAEPTPTPTELKPAPQPKLEIDDKVSQKVDDAFRYGTVTGLSKKNILVTWDKKSRKEKPVTESVNPDTLVLTHRKPKFETTQLEKPTNQRIHRLASYQAGQILTKSDGKILGTITGRGKEGKEGIYYECTSTKLTRFVSFDDIDLYEYQRFWP